MKTVIVLLIIVAVVIFKMLYPKRKEPSNEMLDVAVCSEAAMAALNKAANGAAIKVKWPGDGDPENGGGQTHKDDLPQIPPDEIEEVGPPMLKRTPFVDVCQCSERERTVNCRAWRITHYKHNHSDFHGGYQDSDYSGIMCLVCGHSWRTKAKYVETLVHITDLEEKMIAAAKRYPAGYLSFDSKEYTLLGEYYQTDAVTLITHLLEVSDELGGPGEVELKHSLLGSQLKTIIVSIHHDSPPVESTIKVPFKDRPGGETIGEATIDVDKGTGVVDFNNPTAGDSSAGTKKTEE